jgi:adenosylhomocysteine nucleosidase
MPPIAILTAVPQEFEQIAAVAHVSGEAIVGDVAFVRAALGGVDVVLAQCGIGKVNAAFAATVMLDRLGCSAMVFCGVAGSLNPRLQVGDVVIARRLVQHDYGVLADQAFWPGEPGQIPVARAEARHPGYALPPALERGLVEATAGVVLPEIRIGGTARRPVLIFGAVLTGDTFLNCAHTRAGLQALHQGDAIEMEGAAVAQVAAKFSAPCVVIRTVSDDASGGSHLDFAAFATMAAANSAALTPAVVGAIAEFLRG